MREPRIDTSKLSRMLSEGETVTECAKYFNVSKAAVSKAKKKLGIVVAKEVQLESAHRFIEQHLNTVAQLQNINKVTNRLLDELTGEKETTNRMAEAVQAVLAYEEEPTKDRLKDLKAIILRINQDKNTAIKACAEIRGQLRLQNETLAMLTEMKGVYEFQQELIQLLKDIDPEVKDEFLRRLAQKQAIRRAIRLN